MQVGEAWVDISTRDNQLVKGLADAQSKVEKSMNAISAKMANVGKVMTIAGAAITAAFGLTVKAAMDFNKEVANIATLIPGSTKRVDELKSAIRDMAVTVGKDTTDLAQGAYQVISAWGDTADTVAILGIAAKAATAGVATTTDAIDLLSAVTKGYGDTSIEAVQKVSDLAFQTVTLGQTTFPELAASIGKVIPLTSELGVSQEELFAVMATGTGVTGKAAEVSTQLRGIMQSLMSPTGDMIKLLEEKGYASGEAMLADLGLAGALDLIKSAAEALGMPLQKYISSIEGQTLALALTGTQADTYIEKLAAMRDSTGLTDIAFKEQTEGVNAAGFAFQQAKIQIAVLTQEIGDKLLPMLIPLIQKFTEIVGKVRDWAEENKPLTETIVKWTAGAGALMLVLGPLLIILPQLVKGISLLSGAITPLTVTIGLAIANLIIWYEVIKEIDEILKSHHTTIKDVEAAENRLAEVQSNLAAKLGITVEELKEFQKAGTSVSEMMGIELIPATYDFASVLAEVERVAKKTEESIKKLTETTDEFKAAQKSLADKIFELTHTAMEIAIKKLDEEKQSYIDLGMSIEEVNKWYDLAIKKLEELNELKDEEIDLNVDIAKTNKKVADSIKEIGEETRKTTTLTQFLGTKSVIAFGYIKEAVDKARISLSNFTIEGVAAAITQIKMSYYPEIARLSELIRGLFGAGQWRLREWYEADLKRVLKSMQSEIDAIMYGFREYSRTLASLGGTITTPSTSGTWAGLSYQTGTPYVPRTGLALVHKGEEINPPGQRSYDQRKSYTSTASINIQPGAINIVTPKFSSADGQNLFRQLERQIKMRGLKLVRV